MAPRGFYVSHTVPPPTHPPRAHGWSSADAAGVIASLPLKLLSSRDLANHPLLDLSGWLITAEALLPQGATVFSDYEARHVDSGKTK